MLFIILKKKKQSTAKDDNKQWEMKFTCVGPFNAPFPQEVATQESCRLNTLLCFTFSFLSPPLLRP